MNAFMTVAVSREGADQYELSEFIQNTLVPEVQRKGGVSSVSSSGLVEKLVQVQLNQDKIDEINAKLLELIDTQLAEARSQLESAEAQITAGRREYEKQLKKLWQYGVQLGHEPDEHRGGRPQWKRCARRRRLFWKV